jgi:hypothetical protein
MGNAEGAVRCTATGTVAVGGCSDGVIMESQQWLALLVNI